jgi:hypothetical protein
MTEITPEGTRFYGDYYLRYHNKEGNSELVDPELDHLAKEEDPRLVLPFALADANDIRRALAIGEGKLDELPVAILGNSEDCVLARALSNGWDATVSSSDTSLSHPLEGMTLDKIRLAVQTLGQLGFINVTYSPSYEIDPGVPDAFYARYWIYIPHTWAMTELVNWYDRGAYPELVLGSDHEGQGAVARFKKWISSGVSLVDIREGRVPD